MSTNELLLLGLLGRQRMHGYELHEFLERQLGFLSDLKKPTAYRLLEAMGVEGLVEGEVERHGRRPERRVYRLTPRGQERFLDLLRAELEQPSYPHGAGNIALLFADQLPSAERAQLIGRRLAALEGRRGALADLVSIHPPGTTARLVLEHDLAHLDAEISWLGFAEGSLAALGGPNQ